MSLSESDIRIGQIWKTDVASYMVVSIKDVNPDYSETATANGYTKEYKIVNIADENKSFVKYVSVFDHMQLISDVNSSKENNNEY